MAYCRTAIDYLTEAETPFLQTKFATAFHWMKTFDFLLKKSMKYVP